MDPPEKTQQRFTNLKTAKSTRALCLSSLCLLFWFSLSSETRILAMYKVKSASKPAGLEESPFSRVALMGQFNYGKLPIQSLLFWTNTMKKYGRFADVVLRGAFFDKEANHTLDTLRHNHNIDIRPSPKTSNEGFFAPYLNVASYMKELQQSNSSHKIDGVLYLHDDTIPNFKFLKTVFERTKNQAVVGTDLGKRDRRNFGRDGSYEDPRDIQNKRKWYHDSEVQEQKQDGTKRERKGESEGEWRRRMSLNHYRIYPFGWNNSTRGSHHENLIFSQTTENQRVAYTNVFGNILFDNYTHMSHTLNSWGMRDKKICAKGIDSFASDPEAWPYLEYHDSRTWTLSKDIPSQADTQHAKLDYFLLVPTYTQADFLYIPLKYTDLVLDLSGLLYKHQVWIECAFPIIVDQISKRARTTSNKGYSAGDKPVPAASAVTVPLCTNWGAYRNTLQMIENCEKNWHIDVARGKLPLFYQHRYGGSVPNATGKGKDFNFGHFGAVHPMKLGANSSKWEEAVKLTNGK